jgi:hypothetical protein
VKLGSCCQVRLSGYVGQMASGVAWLRHVRLKVGVAPSHSLHILLHAWFFNHMRVMNLFVYLYEVYQTRIKPSTVFQFVS